MKARLLNVRSLGFHPATVIDVGTGFGTSNLYDVFPSAHLVLIEPLQEFEPRVREIARRYGGDYVIAAAAERSGVTMLDVREDLDASGIATSASLGGAGASLRRVHAVALDELRETLKLQSPFLIKVDVQGAELRVLDGASKLLQDTEVIILEVSMFRFTPETPDLFDVVSYMKARGFVVYDFLDGRNRPVDGALGQIDVVFVRERGMLRHASDWA